MHGGQCACQAFTAAVLEVPRRCVEVPSCWDEVPSCYYILQQYGFALRRLVGRVDLLANLVGVDCPLGTFKGWYS